MIELRDNDGWIADLNPEKISAYGVRPASFLENGIIKDHAQFFVVCDSREFTSNLEPVETFERFRLALGFKQKQIEGPRWRIGEKFPIPPPFDHLPPGKIEPDNHSEFGK